MAFFVTLTVEQACCQQAFSANDSGIEPVCCAVQ